MILVFGRTGQVAQELARLAPRAAPSLSASGVSTSLNLSLEPRARPPETMILAAPSSGRSDLTISSETKAVLDASAPATLSTGAEPPSAAAATRQSSPSPRPAAANSPSVAKPERSGSCSI